MNCAEFQDWLQQRLDGERVGDSGEVDRHLTSCSTCRDLDAIATRLLEQLNARTVPLPPNGVRNRLVSSILNAMASQRLARRRWSRRAMIASAVAAGLLIAILGYTWWGSRQTSDVLSSNPLVKKDEKPTSAQPPLNFQEAGTTLVALVNRTADETVGQGRVLLPQGVPSPNLTSSGHWPTHLDPSSQAIRDAQDGVAVSFEPVTSSARRAVNLFLREVPSMESQKQ